MQVYHEAGLHERGLRFVDHMDHCLEHIYPSLTDLQLSKLIYMLDYAANFYDQLAVYVPFDPDKEFNQGYWALTRRLNTTLVDILKFDLMHRGEFFPEM